MKKIFSTFIFLILILISLIIIVLSTTGIETNKFSNFISKKVLQLNNDIKLDINTIKFKFDINEMSLFLGTINPQLDFKEINIPTKNIKVYVDFISLIKTEPKIQKINVVLDKIDNEKLKKLSIHLKPSNLKRFINSRIEKLNLNLEIEAFFKEDNLIDDFIARGSIEDLKVKIYEGINLEKTSFNFIADKSDILLKNIKGQSQNLNIYEGDLKINLSQDLTFETNFKTNIKYDIRDKDKIDTTKISKFLKDLNKFNAILNNNLKVSFDKTYKIKNYNFKSIGKMSNVTFKFKNSLKYNFFDNRINLLSLKDTNVEFFSDFKVNKVKLDGKYSSNDEKFLNYSLENKIIDKKNIYKLDADFIKPFNLDIVNYQKSKKSIANITLNLNKYKDRIEIDKVKYSEGKNLIIIEGVKLKKGKFSSLKKISVKTFDDNSKNNDFTLFFSDKISIKGSHFDSTNLPKILNQSTNSNIISNVNKDIMIDIKDIKAPLSEKLKNFKLIGKIENGKFIKISSKGDFGNNNYLDISMKKDKNDKKKYLEIYSDLTKPLLTEFSFFKGLTGGKLFYTSIIDGDSYNSKLKIENFKVINAPGMVKLLSLADLGGLADLAEGDGLTFDILEIEMEKNRDSLKLNEILALGPSVSVLMEGYQDSTITSLRGTLVPAKTLNKMISKIPLIGDIVIPKEVGEGLFGISFKMKGPPGKIKTTINPIRTLTPRFIQKIVDRKKKSN